MKLTETIDECIKLVIDEIESVDYEIKWTKKTYGDLKERNKELEEDKKRWMEHLENLKYIQAETNLESWEVDEQYEWEQLLNSSGEVE